MLKKKLKDNLLLKGYIQGFRKAFLNQKYNRATLKTMLDIYKQLKNQVQQRYITTLKTTHSLKKQKNLKNQTKLNQKNYNTKTLSFYTNITKNIIIGKNKTYLNELQYLIKNIARLQFKNQWEIKKKKLKSYNYTRTQN